MARENQGLQIALIVFVMLTIVLGVTTFLFFRQYEEATTRANAAEQKATESSTAARTAVEEANTLKRLIGFAATDTVATIEEAAAGDMRTYAGTMPEENRFYRTVLEYMFTVLKDRDTELTDTKLALETLKNEFRVREASKDPQIASADKRATDAEAALKAAMADYGKERDRMKADQDKVAASLVSARKEQDEAVAKLSTKLEGQAKRIEGLTRELSGTLTTIREMKDPHLAVADGEIRWVNQRAGTVWINLGRADGLSRQASFAVYNADASDLSPEAKKASIEVTQILGDHLAEARIVDDELSDPVQLGDKIQTPIWNPGEQKRFALAGKMDINGDGREDFENVRNIITMHGGQIDAYMRVTPKPEMSGTITANTTYLVLGAAPDENSPAEVRENFTKMIDAAKRLQVPTISVNDLLQQMGWRSGSSVTYGNAPDVKGVTGGSGEGSAPEFRNRRPPSRNATSAY